jgi:hypothetical protein
MNNTGDYNHDRSAAEDQVHDERAELQDKHNATEADKWHNDSEYEWTQFEIDEIDETQVPTEKKPSASIPDFAQLKALPDFDVQLPEGWICKQHSSTVADK